MKTPKLYKNSYFNNVVVVTGSLNSGKSMVAPIVSSLHKVEHLRKLIEVDQILHLVNLRKIEKEAAFFFLRHYLDKFYQLIEEILIIGSERNKHFTANTNELVNRIFKKENI